MRKANEKDQAYIESFIKEDYARHYFIALGLMTQSFKDIYIGENCLLFHRKSGNLQFAYKSGDINEVKKLLENLDFDLLIGPESTCSQLGLRLEKKGAYIAALDKKDYTYIPSQAEQIGLEDLEAIENLYSKIFPGYPKASYMKDKLEDKRGMGYMIKDKDIVSVAQSDFYELIVGVATHPDYLRKGYALTCMHQLINEMFKSVDRVYLQYDNPDAGRLYEKLGFKIIDQVIHYKR